MSNVEWLTLIIGIVTALAAVAAVVIALVALNKTQEVTVDHPIEVSQPLEVKFAAEFVSKQDFKHLADTNEQAHRDLFSKIGGVERGGVQALNAVRQEMHGMELRINESGEERSAKIHDRVNEVLAEVSEIRGELKRLES